MKLIIPRVPIGPNGPKGLFRLHWAARAKVFEGWALEVQALVRQQPLVVRFVVGTVRRRRVRVHQVRKRKLDRDNLWASVKPCVDALVKNALIVDDSEKWIDLTVTQETGKPVRTEITIE